MTPRSERGFVLLLVLWTLALLALIGTQVTAAGRSEAQVATNLRAAGAPAGGGRGRPCIIR